jgi:hypothetical protein
VIGVPDAYRGQAGERPSSRCAGARPSLTLEALRGILADRLGRH